MSHFTLLIVGDDIEGQMEKYNENREVAPYVELQGEALDEELKKALGWLWATEATRHTDGRVDDRTASLRKIIAKDTALDALTLEQKFRLASWWYSEEDLKIEGGEIVKYSTYNQDSKWDWYEIGGRWNGFFTLKPGATGLPVKPHYSEVDNPPDKTGRTDQARKGDIDFDLMRTEAAVQAAQEFQLMQDATEGIEPPTESWETVMRRALGGLAEIYFSEENIPTSEETDTEIRRRIDQAREERNRHPFIRALRAAQLSLWGDPYEEYCLGHENPVGEYVRRARASVTSTYAMLIDGEWVARGEMGWFGISRGDLDKETWSTKVAETIDGLPDDTLLTLADCHI